MAFWGIEVKPGRPVTHSFDRVRRRLRISQATLGIGQAVEKSLVQCNIGNKSPVLICALLPKMSESCHLDLEFEEADDVIFSVIGPRSVYLTGYFVGNYLHSALHSDTESYGEDIANTNTEESGHDSDGDEYDDSFIDDGDPVIAPPSPDSSNGISEEILDKTEGEGKGNDRLRRKIILSSDSDEETSSPEDEDEDKFPLSVLMRKKAVKDLVSELEGKPDEVRFEINENVKATDSGSSAHVLEEKIDAVTLLQKANSEPDLPKKTKCKRKRKQDFDALEGSMGNHEKTLQQDKLVQCDSNHQDASFVEGPSSKKRKKGGKEKSNGRNKTTSNDQLKENKELGVLDLPATTSEEKKTTADLDTGIDVLAEESQLKRKKKDKIKKNKDNMNVSLLSANESEKPSKPCELRRLSNGLVIEELAMGDQDGKIATSGRKVKVYYTGLVKESGHVFDSNIGKDPYKFRLGDEEIIEGWNVGIEGMRVGGKRRLTIPPIMGYGKQGNGENIPPNSWVVFDIELVRVYR